MNLTTKQAAERLGISEQRVRQLIGAGTLKAEKFGGSHSIKERDLGKVTIHGKAGRPVRLAK